VGQECREVFAHAGVALSQVQTLELVLKGFVVITAIERGTPETSIISDVVARTIADNEKFEAALSKYTLGQLIGAAKLYLLTARRQALDANLMQSLKDGNRLVHHFLPDNAVQQQTAHGNAHLQKPERLKPNCANTLVLAAIYWAVPNAGRVLSIA
jgi:hypothetical protein